MAIGNVGYEQQYVLRDAGGNIIWQGGAVTGNVYTVTSTESSTTNGNGTGSATTQILAGTGVIADPTNLVIPRDANPGTSDPDVQALSALGVGAASVGFLGVALQPIAVGKRGNVAGPGSIIAVRMDNTACAAGKQIKGFGPYQIGSSGVYYAACTVQVARDASNPVYGTTLGVCLKAAAQVGSTGIYTAVVLVSQG